MIDLHLDGPVAVLSIDRDDQRNALDIDHCHAIREAVDRSADGQARCLVLTGRGQAFCSGADFEHVADVAFREALYSMLRRIIDAPMPVVAAINGPAIGAGLQLAIACDLRVAGPAASFGIPSARLGVAVDPWTIRRLASLVGAGSSALLLLASRNLAVDQAVAAGLVEQTGDLDDALALAADIATAAPLSLAYSKRVLQTLTEDGVDDQLAEAFDACWTSADLIEGLRARREKRRPMFDGH